MTAAPDQRHSPTPIAERVTAEISAALARGVKPWLMPFTTMPPPLPIRSTGETYRGSNVLTLWAAAATDGFLNSHWLTFKQAQALGGQVRRGARGRAIVYYEPRLDGAAGLAERGERTATPSSTAPDEPAPRRRGAILRAYTVFNADQIEALPDNLQLATAAPSSTGHMGALHAAFSRVPATIVQSAKAYFNPDTDTVHIPPPAAFIDDTRYLSTLAHELAHWTGHPTRLNRQITSQRFGDRAYALEELVAELTAAFIGAELRLPVEHIEDHSSYIGHWLAVLADDPGAFLTAAARAQAAADYLRAFLHFDGATTD